MLVAHGFVAKVIRALLTGLSWDAFFRDALKNGEVAHYPLTQGLMRDFGCPFY